MDEDDLIQEDEFFDDDVEDEEAEPYHDDTNEPEDNDELEYYIVEDDDDDEEEDDIWAADVGDDDDIIDETEPYHDDANEPDQTGDSDDWFDPGTDPGIDPFDPELDPDDDEDDGDDGNDDWENPEVELIEDPLQPKRIPDSQGGFFGSNYRISNAVNASRGMHSLQIIRDTEAMFTASTAYDEDEDEDVTTFDLAGANTWNHFRLIPSSRPVIAPPEFRSSFIEIPGADGLLDVSTALSDGYPLCGRRKGDIEFYVTRDYNTYYSWTKVYSNIMSNIHGRLVKCILMDDPAFYYRGRITVNQWRSEKDWSKIVLNYDFEPYKYALFSTRDRWLWDPFDFVEGVVTDPVNYFGIDGEGFEITAGYDMGGNDSSNNGHYHDFVITAGDMRFTPKVVVTNNDPEYSIAVSLRINLSRKVKNNGNYIWEPIILSDHVLRFDIEPNSTKTVSVYNVSVKNGTYLIRFGYLSGLAYINTQSHSSSYDGDNPIKVGLLYRYGSL